MADIVLNVEVRESTGTGGARAARAGGKVPGVLYGGKLGPVPIAVKSNEFRKALYSGKLLGHLVTLKYGDETQPVIAKDIQFHPVNDEPMHFDLYRVDEHQLIKIAVPVHFRNEDECPGLRRGGALTIAFHELDVMAPADSIPEELIADLTGLDIGAQIHISAIAFPKGVSPAEKTDVVVATISGAMAEVVDETTEAAAEEGGEEAAAEEATEE